VSEAPETEGAARAWQRVVDHARTAGLCATCAAQLAWGVQNGFSTVHPPCDECAPIIAGWPVPRQKGWRTRTGRLSRAEAWVEPRDTSDHGAGRLLMRSGRVDELLRERDG